MIQNSLPHYWEGALIIHGWNLSIIDEFKIEDFLHFVSQTVKELIADESSGYKKKSLMIEYQELVDKISNKLQLSAELVKDLKKIKAKWIKQATIKLHAFVAVYEIISLTREELTDIEKETFRNSNCPELFLALLLDSPEIIEKLTPKQIELYWRYRIEKDSLKS